MSSNAIAFLSGLGSGYIDADKDAKKLARDEEDRALRNEAARLQLDEAKSNAADKKTLRLAGAPVAMTEGAGGMLKPEAMDNRDVGLPENATLPNQGLQEGGFNVAGKSFADRGMADAAVQAANTPQAVGKRTAAALYGMGKPGEAMQLEASAKQAEMTDIQLGNAKWRAELGGAMAGGHDKMAELVTKTEVGILKGQKAQVIRKGDGMVSYGTIDKDGKVTAVPGLTFPDTQDGVAMAGFMLDKEVTPKDRMDFARQGKKD